MNDLILYTTEDGRSQVKPQATTGTRWIVQKERIWAN